jgi:hypothetical protein
MREYGNPELEDDLNLRQVDERGTITLPREIREGLGYVDVVRRADGVVELRPVIAVDQTQAWFWTPKWQGMERQADAEIRQGAVHQATAGEFLDVLSSVSSADPEIASVAQVTAAAAEHA